MSKEGTEEIRGGYRDDKHKSKMIQRRYQDIQKGNRVVGIRRRVWRVMGGGVGGRWEGKPGDRTNERW